MHYRVIYILRRNGFAELGNRRTYDDTGKIFNASSCGDNCAKWIVEIGKRKDLTINLHHVLDFSSADEFDALMLNTGRMIRGYREYFCEAMDIKER